VAMAASARTASAIGGGGCASDRLPCDASDH
jgi:hypothetical protein